MTGLTLAVVLQTSILMNATVPADSYTAARKDCNQTGRPMIVLVGAQWCPACVEMKNDVIPKMKRRGLLRRVAFAQVDLDRQQTLGRQLTAGGPIPQIIMYRKTREGWRRRTLIGGQSVETLSAFIKDGVRLSDAAKKSESQETKKEHATTKPTQST